MIDATAKQHGARPESQATRWRRPWLLIACLTALGWFGHAAAPALAAEASCKPYIFIGARGSSETGDYGEGPVQTTFAKLTALDASTRYVQSEPLNKAAGYDAVPVYTKDDLANIAIRGLAAVAVGRKAQYDQSVAGGKNALKAVFDRLSADCGGSKFILVGYSQGAHVIQDVVDGLPDASRRRILAVAQFGDPRFNPRARGALDTFSPARHGLLGQRDLLAQDVSTRTFCRAGDPVCQGLAHVSYVFPAGAAVELFSPGAHAEYSNEDAGFAAAFIWQRIRKDITASGGSAPPQSAPAPRALDLSIVVDTTGSMGSAINNVRTNLGDIRTRLAATTTDFRLALSDFKDSGDAYQARLDTDLTADAGTFSATVNTLAAQGGGDTPESVYAGISKGLGVSFRTGVARALLLIGDASPKNPEPVTSNTEDSIVAASQRMSAPIYGLPICCDSSADSAFTSLSTRSGGRVIRASSGSAVADAILSAIAEQIKAPSFASAASPGGAGSGTMARLASAESASAARAAAPVGTPIAITAADATSPLGQDLTYSWDFGDGTRAMTDSAVTDHAWATPFQGDVVVTVTDEEGRKAQRRTAVDVSGAPIPALDGLKAPTVQASADGVDVAWSAPATGQTVQYEVLDSVGTTVAAVVANEDGSIPTQVTLPGSTSTTFLIVATDAVGRTTVSPPGTLPSPVPAPATSAAPGATRPDTVSVVPTPRRPAKKFSVQTASVSGLGGRVGFRLSVPEAGRLTVNSSAKLGARKVKVATLRAAIKRSGTVRVSIRLPARARAALRRGSVRLTARFTYVAASGMATTIARSVTVPRVKTGRRR